MSRFVRWVAWRLERPLLSEGRAAMMRWRMSNPYGCRGRCSEMHTYRRGCVMR